MNQDAATFPMQEQAKKEPRGILFGLEIWEIAVIALSIFLILFVAIPNYFGALSMMRGQECSRRLLLVANSLKYLAVQNQVKPGEKICEPLELNQTLDLAQGALKIEGSMEYVPAFFRYGTEPDCSDGGDFNVNFYLGEDGEIVPPTCNRFDEIGADYCREHNMHFCDMSQVDGVLTEEQENAKTGTQEEPDQPAEE